MKNREFHYVFTFLSNFPNSSSSLKGYNVFYLLRLEGSSTYTLDANPLSKLMYFINKGYSFVFVCKYEEINKLIEAYFLGCKIAKYVDTLIPVAPLLKIK